jgi:hypothetical protein
MDHSRFRRADSKAGAAVQDRRSCVHSEAGSLALRRPACMRGRHGAVMRQHTQVHYSIDLVDLCALPRIVSFIVKH